MTPAILVDASGYIYRAFYAQPPLSRSDGMPTGCIHGYVRMLWGLKRQHADASHFAVIFDKGKSAKRVALYPSYKANRPPMHEDLRAQLAVVRDATRAFGFPVVEQDGVEADDLIASYAEAFAQRGQSVIIASADKDMMQLIEPPVIEMFDTLKGRLIDTDDVIAKLGVPPRLAVDAQALIGDSVDNIPGARGIGPKNAGKLLMQYGDLDSLLANWRDVKPASARDSLLNNREAILLSRALATLSRDVPLPLPLEAIESANIDVNGVLEFARQMEFVSFAADVAAHHGVAA